MQAARALVLVTGLVACERAAKAPPPPAPEPVVVVDAGGDPRVDELIAETLAYMEQLPGLLLAFDGNCDAHVERLLTLEPLVRSIRAKSEVLRQDGRSMMDVVQARFKAQEHPAMAKLDAQLAARGATRADVSAKEDAVKAACGDNVRVKDAMDRVGVFRRKTP